MTFVYDGMTLDLQIQKVSALMHLRKGKRVSLHFGTEFVDYRVILI